MEENINPIEEKIDSPASEEDFHEGAGMQKRGLARFLAPKSAIIAVGILAVAVAGFFVYRAVVLHEEISEFELSAQRADSAGVEPGSTFILKSSADLSAAVIRRNLSFDPPVEYVIKKVSNNSSVFEIIPESELHADAIYTIVIEEGGIAARPYSWAYQVKAPFQIISSLPRDRGTSVPLNTGIEIVFNREGLEQYQESFSIEPAVAGRFETHRNTFVFVPTKPLAPETLYTVRVRLGVRSEGSRDTLVEEKVVRFETAQAPYASGRSYFSFQRNFWEFAPDTNPAFGVYADGALGKTVLVRVYRAGSAEEFMQTYKDSSDEENFWTSYHRFRDIALPDSTKVFEGGILVETQGWRRFARMPRSLPEGFYVIEAISEGNYHSYAWFQMTPVAAFSAMSGTQTLVWLKDMPSGKNGEGARISIEGRALGETNSDGVLVFPTPSELVRAPGESYEAYRSRGGDYFFTAALGGRTVVIPVGNDFGYFSKVLPPDAWWDYFSTDKTIYLPNDTVRFWGIVRERSGEDIRGENLKIELTNSYWDGTPKEDITVYGETEATISDFYTITGSISFSHVRPGFYQLSVKRGNEVIVSDHINVETYIKPAYRLLLSPDKEALFAGDSVTYSVKAEFFDGTPVPNLLVAYSGYLEDEYKGQVRLDARGEGRFTLATDYRDGEYWPRYFGMSVRPAVAEEGKIDAYTSVLVFGPRMKLLVDEIIGKESTRFAVSLSHIALDRASTKTPYWYPDLYLGNPVSDWLVRAKIYEVIYRANQIDTGYDPIQKTTYPIYSYSREERLVREQELRTGSDGKTSLEFAPEKGRSYYIDFSARDAGGRVTRDRRYVYGGEYSYYGFHAPGSVVLRNTKETPSYRVGDPISLRLQDDGGRIVAPGSGKFVFLRIANGIQSYQITDEPVYTEAFRESYIPNVQIMAVWFTGSRFEDSYPVNLSYDAEEKRLSLSVEREKERYRPGENVSLKVVVKDGAGKPQRAEVNLAGIDEAVFSLRPEERDVVNTLYQDVFTNVITRSSHYAPFESGAEKGCFLEGTLVRTPVGERKIEDIRAGDDVMTLTESGEDVRARVSKTSVHFVAGYVVVNDSLGLTINHRLLVNGEWKEAGALEVGDELLGQDGARVPIRSVKRIREWRTVYNIEVDTYHTFFANGVFVHNEEKGGGGARADFREVAIYESKVTDGNGIAQFSFAVPDSITSWRLTLQAVTKDLRAGKQIEFLPVGLPFFVDAAINRTYLAGDEFALRLRTFGSAKTSDMVSYAVESSALASRRIERSGGDTIEIPFGALLPGKHTVSISAKSGAHADAIERTISVLESYFTETKTEWYEVSPSLSNIRGSEKGFTALLFASYERGRFYPLLQRLSCACGARADQKITSLLANLYRKRFFGDEVDPADIDATRYQTPSGAIALLPYSDDDLELSAKFAHLAKDEETISVSREFLVRYLNSTLNDKKSDAHRVAAALYGLSASRSPILVSLERLKNDKELTMLDRIYVALAFNALGAKEEARAYYRSAIKPKLVEKTPFAYIEHPTDSDETILMTTLLAGLAADLRESEADGLGAYAARNYPKRTLHSFELLLYARASIPALKEGDVSFSYSAGSKEGSVALKKAETFRLDLSPEELRTLAFKDVDGRVSLATVFDAASDPSTVARDPTIGIERSYSAFEGGESREFKEGDLIRITLRPIFDARALPGAYQIIDYVPSGLRPVTNTGFSQYGYRGEGIVYPSDVEDQKVTFVVWNAEWWRRPLSYYARVVSKGIYKAEPALIQSLESTDTKNISQEAIVHIR